MGSVADSDDVMSVAPSDFSLVSDVQDAQTSAPDGQPMEAMLPGHEVSRGDFKPVHHPVFSFENDLVALQVEHTIFTVHAHLFDRQSPQARAFIERRHAAPNGVIVVEDISAVDLERFLTMLYSKSYDPARLHTKEDWTAVLALAHRWDFAAIRAVAIGELVAITTPIDRLVLARDYNIGEWLAGAYLDVCQASEYPSDEDCLRLDRATIVMIGRAREALRSPGTLVPFPARAELIRRVFETQSDSTNHSVPLDSASHAALEEPAAPASAMFVEAKPTPGVPATESGDEALPEGSLILLTAEVPAKSTLITLIDELAGRGRSSFQWAPYQACGTYEELGSFNSALEDAGHWVRVTNRSEDECFMRLALLEDDYKPMMERFLGLRYRSRTIDQLVDALTTYLRRSLSGDKNACISASETSRVSKLCLETRRWLNNAIGDPVTFTTEVILARRREVDELARSVFNHPHKR